ncbi:hypothetical protein EVAR_42698_1 [Eumeta japonica]|uniref:Uncharacterized protein n=1 Tax=Eumeta variegata TaxID=151549 RepID=A0A4C1X2K0_EUMVA|nr:hypothetical protein EVAR_42698_1 [Eumeta japonica]
MSQSPKISPSSIPNPNPSVTTTKTIESGYPKYGGYLYSIPGYSAFQPINYQNLALTTNPPTLLSNEHSNLWSSIRKDSICADEKILDDKSGMDSKISKPQTDFEDNFTSEIVSTPETKKPLNQESTMQITSLAQGSAFNLPKIHAPYANISPVNAESTRVEIQSNVVIKSANCKDVETKVMVAENRSVNASNISTLIDAAEALKNEPTHWEKSPEGAIQKQEAKDNLNTLNTQSNSQSISSILKSMSPMKQAAVNGSSVQDTTAKTNSINPSDNYNDQKNQILFFPNKNSSNPKMLLTISQSQHNPQVLLQRTNFESKNVQAPSRLSTPTKTNEELSGKTEKPSEVVSLKRLHQDDGDENDFENLITENQIYGNKIVVKEKSQATLQDRDLKNKNITNKTPDKNTQTATDTKSLVIQPNILYVSNVQFPANLMMFKNGKVNQIEPLKINKTVANETKTNEFPTISTSEPANSYPTKYPSPQTIAITKEIHVLKPNSNLIQTFSNKQTNKTDIVFQTNQKMIMNPQIVYQVPMVVDAASVSANVQKLTTPFVNRDYTKFLNTQNTKKELNKTAFESTSKANEKLFIACPYQVDSKLQPKIVITNIRPKLPKVDEISALDLYEKRRRMRRIKYLSNRDSKDLKTEIKKNVDKVEGKNIITPDKMKEEVYKEFRNTKLIFTNDSSGSDDEYGEKDLDEYEDIIKRYGVPEEPEARSKVQFLSGFRLATRDKFKELELERQERSLQTDAVASACIAAGRLDRIYGVDGSSLDEDKSTFKSSLYVSLEGDYSLKESPTESGQALQSKLDFFGQLQLIAVSQQHKEDYECVWREILKERCRREGLENKTINTPLKNDTNKLTLDTKGATTDPDRDQEIGHRKQQIN